MSELNPNHPVTIELREQWHKLCAILLFKSGATEVQITADDIERFANSVLTNITIHPEGDVLTLALVSSTEAARLAREGRGLPI